MRLLPPAHLIQLCHGCVDGGGATEEAHIAGSSLAGGVVVATTEEEEGDEQGEEHDLKATNELQKITIYRRKGFTGSRESKKFINRVKNTICRCQGKEGGKKVI